MKRRPSVELTINVEPTCEPRQVKPGSIETLLEQDFEILETLGRGSVGVVRHARRRSDGIEVALKMVPSQKSEVVAVEYALLKSLNHPYIVKCYGWTCMKSIACELLLLEYFEGRSLQKLAPEVHRTGEVTSHVIFMALLSAVAFLHDHDVIHRDIKADNVLVSEDFSDIRLIDFNTSRRLVEGETPLTVTGTHSWSAPEVFSGDFPGKPNDVWGIGLCLYFMVFGQLPFALEDIEFDVHVGNLLTFVENLKQGDLSSVSKECMTTLRHCLEVDKTMRVEAHSLWQSDPFNSQSAITSVS